MAQMPPSPRRIAIRWLLPGALWAGAAAALAAPTVDLELVSRRAYSPGDPGNAETVIEDASPDGRFVLLRTFATNLVAGIEDDNGTADLVVLDSQTGTRDWITSSASRPGHSAAAIGENLPSGKISADGRFVAYATESRDAAAGVLDVNSAADVFLFDRATRGTTLVSHQAGSTTTAVGGELAEFSPDGRWVLFSSLATTLVAGLSDLNQARDYFLFDRNSGGSNVVGNAAGAPAVTSLGGINRAYGISDDGRWVVFDSSSSDLVTGFQDYNGGGTDLYLFDRNTASSTLISHALSFPKHGARGTMADLYGPAVYMTPDGSYVTYAHGSDNLVLGCDSTIWVQTYRWERSTGSNRLVSGVGGAANQCATGRSRPNAISPDGRYILVQSWAFDLIANLITFPERPGLFRADLSGPSLTLVNFPVGVPNAVACCDGVTGRGISDDGRYVLYDGGARLVAAGQEGHYSAFLYDHTTRTNQVLAHVPGQPTVALYALARFLSADGRYSHLESFLNLAGIPGPETYFDAFVYDRAGDDAIERLSTTNQAGLSAGLVAAKGIAFAGGDLLFHSAAADLVPGFTDSNQAEDPLLFLPATSTFSPLVHAAGNPGQAVDGWSWASFLPDGQTFLLRTRATDVAAGILDTNGGADLYFGQRDSGTIKLVSSALGQPDATANGPVYGGQVFATPAASYVAFDTLATNATPASDGNSRPDTVRWAFGSSGAALISHAAGNPGASAAGESQLFGISDGGDKLVFSSTAANVIPSFVDHNASQADLYLWRPGGSVLVTRQSPGGPNQGSAGRPCNVRLAADGGVVLFDHNGSDLVPGTTGGTNTFDVYAFDTASESLSLAVHALGGPTTKPNADAWLRFASGDGRFVLIDSAAGDLVAPATGAGEGECYLLDRRLGRIFLISHRSGNPSAKAGGYCNALSADGRYVIFASQDAALVPGQLPSADGSLPYSLVLHDRATGERLLLTHVPGNDRQPGILGYPDVVPVDVALHADGSSVAFVTSETGLVADDPGGMDLFFGRIDRGGLIFSDGFELGDSSLWSTFGGQ